MTFYWETPDNGLSVDKDWNYMSVAPNLEGICGWVTLRRSGAFEATVACPADRFIDKQFATVAEAMRWVEVMTELES